jgi:DNA-binding IclR family transcriptional regulator
MKDILNLLQAPEIGEGLTTAELVAKTKMSRGWVDDRLNNLISQGLIEVSWKEQISRIGTKVKAPAYRLKGASNVRPSSDDVPQP